MARFHEPTPEQIAAWNEWVAARPRRVRRVAKRFNPWTLYRLETTGQRVVILSFTEEPDKRVTVRVGLRGDSNLLLFERDMFGIDPDHLSECDLPTPDEVVGAVLDDQEVGDNIDALRVATRPDLWVMGEDGKARRKQ